MEIINGIKCYDYGEIIKPNNEVSDPVVVQPKDLPPFEVSRSFLAHAMRELGQEPGEPKRSAQEQALNPIISGDVLAVLLSIQAAVSDKHPVVLGNFSRRNKKKGFIASLFD